MATFVKFNSWAENMVEVANLGTDQFTIALTNSAPNAATNTVLADITEITYTNLSTRNITTSSSSQTGGTYTLVFTDLVLTSSGGSTGPFRYVVLYDNTPTSPADPLAGYWDYGSSITLQDTETLTIDLGGTGFLQVAV